MNAQVKAESVKFQIKTESLKVKPNDIKLEDKMPAAAEREFKADNEHVLLGLSCYAIHLHVPMCLTYQIRY